MSVVHRVIILNKPLKLRGYTISQWVLLGLTLVSALIVASWIPPTWKIGGLPVCFLVGLTVFCVGIVFVHAGQMKPPLWWMNQIYYRLNIYPKLYFPHREEGVPYPDPTIIEAGRREDESYVTSDE
jgi:hypothetical protein